MGEYKISGIVIASLDYKERDKLIAIYSVELGKVTAVLRGVKNKNAKLKFASQLFCFAEFILVKRGEFFTVTSAEQIESFYDITKDYSKFLAGEVILEIVNQSAEVGEINEKYFLHMLKALRSLTYDDVNEMLVLLKFLLISFAVGGYNINFDQCNVCSGRLIGEIFFNFDIGAVTCKTCSGHYAYSLSAKEYNLLKIINNSDIEQLKTIKVVTSDLISLIALLNKNFENQFTKKLKIINNFLTTKIV